jgi:hypothetical protein
MPPLDAGAIQSVHTVPFPAIALGDLGTVGGLPSRTQMVDVGGPDPTALWERMRKAYEMPFVNPLTRSPVPPVVAPTATQLLPFHFSTTYRSIGAPPVDAGAIHENHTVPLPGTADADRGADGTVACGVAVTVLL